LRNGRHDDPNRSLSPAPVPCGSNLDPGCHEVIGVHALPVVDQVLSFEVAVEQRISGLPAYAPEQDKKVNGHYCVDW